MLSFITFGNPVTSLTKHDLDPLLERLGQANLKFQASYPGLQMERQPVHTLYGGANLYTPGAAQKMAGLALHHIQTYAPTFVDLANALQFPGAGELPVDKYKKQLFAQDLAQATENSPEIIAYQVYERTLQKLRCEAIEDHRVDFEDGYGVRSDEEEDGHALSASDAMAEGVLQDTLPPFVGLRIKALTEEAKIRSLRTLDTFISNLASKTNGQMPFPFRVTLPKVTTAEQVEVLADCLTIIEERCGLPPLSIDIELMIETVQAVLTETGECAMPALVEAGKGRVTAAILGTFDYTATCNIAAMHQDHLHPSADFVRQLMQMSLTGMNVSLSDGITNIMPIPPHRGEDLTQEELEENINVVHAAWRVHFRNIIHSLQLGFYQSWDLNPAQLPIRFAAVYYFFLEGLAESTERLRTFIEQAAQASLVGNTFDDAASAQGLLNFFISGINCGALTEDEALATGITLDELQGRSFLKIVANRSRK
jgi:citrate lyase beta subunit